MVWGMIPLISGDKIEVTNLCTYMQELNFDDHNKIDILKIVC